jgi:hypothetical protein
MVTSGPDLSQQQQGDRRQSWSHNDDDGKLRSSSATTVGADETGVVKKTAQTSDVFQTTQSLPGDVLTDETVADFIEGDPQYYYYYYPPSQTPFCYQGPML